MTPQTMPGGVAFRAKDGAVAIVALLALGPSCCARHRAAPPASTPSEWSLRVENNHWLDVTVYVLHDGERTRLGLVTASSTQSFTLLARLVGQSHELALLGEAVGSRDAARTEVLSVRPGQRIEWTLESDLRRSSIGVY